MRKTAENGGWKKSEMFDANRIERAVASGDVKLLGAVVAELWERVEGLELEVESLKREKERPANRANGGE